MNPTVIEFVGLPGVGKSTVLRELIKLSNDDQISIPTYRHARRPSVSRVATKSWIACKAGYTFPNTVVKLSRLVHESNQQTIQDSAKTGFNIIYILGALVEARNCNQRTVLLDQGFYQALWSIDYTASTDLNISDAASILPSSLQPDIVYIITASDTEIARRLEHRDSSDTRYKPQTDQAQHGGEIMDSLAEYLINTSEVTVRVMPNENKADFKNIITQLKDDIDNESLG